MLAAWWILQRRVSPADVALAAFAAGGIALTAMYFFWARTALFQPADILIWSESPFVNDIIKFRTGVPLYSTPSDFDSFFYTPGAQLLTYALASLAGVPTSIPAYRIVQLVYVATATLLVIDATRRLGALTGFWRHQESPVLWGVVIGTVSFLAAGNSLTNPFTHLLHNDALSLLVCAAGFWGLTGYATTQRSTWLVMLALVPAAGFLVKQSLAVWAPLFLGYLLVFDQPRRWSRIAGFSVVAFGLPGLMYIAGRALWGEPFRYWIIEGLGSHPVSILRVIEHGLDGWAYFAVGFVAIVVLSRSRLDRRTLGLWCVWLALLASETYTSGIAYMRNHMGPGSLLAMPWFGLILFRVWPAAAESSWRLPQTWLRPVATASVCVLVMNGLGTVRVPLPAYPPDMARYVADIEREMQGTDLSRVLLDHGSWVYLPHGVVMKDRMAAIGEAGFTETGDFSGVLGRIKNHYYSRILVRNLSGDDFQYDLRSWRTSSGIRDALNTFYAEVRTIPGVGNLRSPGFLTISVLEPRLSSKETDADSN
jgi:hypothetical protein